MEEGRRQLLFTFEDFVDELSEHLIENADVRHIVAVGKFDNTASAMTVDWMTVSLKELFILAISKMDTDLPA